MPQLRAAAGPVAQLSAGAWRLAVWRPLMQFDAVALEYDLAVTAACVTVLGALLTPRVQVLVL